MKEQSQSKPKLKNPMAMGASFRNTPKQCFTGCQQLIYQEASEDDTFPVLLEVDLKLTIANSDDAQTAIVNGTYALLFIN